MHSSIQKNKNDFDIFKNGQKIIHKMSHFVYHYWASEEIFISVSVVLKLMAEICNNKKTTVSDIGNY